MVSASPLFIVLVSFFCATSKAPAAFAFSQYTSFQNTVQQQRRATSVYPSPPRTWDNIASNSLFDTTKSTSWQLAATSDRRNESEKKRGGRFGLRKLVKNLMLKNPIAWSILTLIAGTAVPSIDAVLGAKPAMASAPVMAMPKAEDLDPGDQAMKLHQKTMAQQTQKKLDDFAAKARKIEATQGPAARAAFEKEFKAEKEQQAIEKANGFIKLKRDLLDQGIDPYCDLEGQRQSILYDTGLDLAEVSGTAFNMEKIYQEKSPKKSVMYQKGPHRAVIRLMVQDMKNRGRDPLEYFESRKEQTLTLLDLPASKIIPLLQTYQANMEQYGQVTQPAPGEMSVKEKMDAAPPAENVDSKVEKEAATGNVKAEKERLKAEAKAEKERLRAEAKAEKERLQAEAKAEKERLQEEAKAAKEEAKRLKAAEKEKAETAAKKAASVAASAAAASAAVGMGALVTTGNAGVVAVESVVQDALPHATATDISAPASTIEAGDAETTEDVDIPVPKPSLSVTAATKSESSGKNVASPVKRAIDNAPVAALVVTAGAGAFGFKIYKDRSAASEAERQRQFRLLMGGAGTDTGAPSSSSSSSTPRTPPPAKALDLMDDLDLSDNLPPAVKKSGSVTAASTAASVPPSPKKKRRLGIFKSSKGGRETDLRKLLEDSEAPEFATLLGKILTFGAPRCFPNAISILGSDMPFEEFDLKKAEELLVQARMEASLEVSQSAEIFANVVNCMLIDIVDLASISLKEKETKIMVDAINIVVDFMNHAASLYEAVAEGVTINPVTYSGDLAKSKLEQIYSQYAVGGMMNADGIPDDFDSRVALLQDVFSINEKKAEGLMLKAMQKNMMEMMKNGGAEGMEGMMKNMGMDPSMMGGAGGMGSEGGMDPEQLKAMLLELKGAKERGEISDEELGMVRDQFKQAFGSSIDDLLKEADSASPEDREFLDLMKSVLD